MHNIRVKCGRKIEVSYSEWSDAVKFAWFLFCFKRAVEKINHFVYGD